MASRPLQWLAYGLLRAGFVTVRLLPRSWLPALGRGLGGFAWRVAGFRREVVLGNLRGAFGGELAEPGLRRLAGAFYRHLGMTLMEFMTLPRLSAAEIRDLVSFEGVEHLEAVKELGQGAILVSGHFGNWELLGARIAAEGLPVNFIVKTQHNPGVDRLQNDIRRRVGIGVIRSGANIKEMIRALRRRELIGMLADQDAGADGVFCDFLGRQASVFRGAAYLAWKLDVPLLSGFIFRRPDGRHVCRIDPPAVADRNLDEDEAVRNLTEIHVRRLEAAIRRAPDHYYWLHRRWKTRPPGERDD